MRVWRVFQSEARSVVADVNFLLEKKDKWNC